MITYKALSRQRRNLNGTRHTVKQILEQATGNVLGRMKEARDNRALAEEEWLYYLLDTVGDGLMDMEGTIETLDKELQASENAAEGLRTRLAPMEVAEANGSGAAVTALLSEAARNAEARHGWHSYEAKALRALAGEE